MKKLIALMLAVLLLASLAGCKKETPSDVNTPAPDNSPTQSVPPESEPPEESTPPVEPEITPDNWGVKDRRTARKDGVSKTYHINLPHYAGVGTGYGRGGEQADGTAAFLFGQDDDSPVIGGISEVFPAYFGDLEYTLNELYGLLSENFEFALTGPGEDVTINGYDMHTFAGTIDYDYDGEYRHYNFVSYATTLKPNGAYAYWVVYDVTEDQSMGDLIAQHALNMAKTFREIE